MISFSKREINRERRKNKPKLRGRKNVEMNRKEKKKKAWDLGYRNG